MTHSCFGKFYKELGRWATARLRADGGHAWRNPILDSWYADPQIRLYGDTYWIFPTYSHGYTEQLFLD